MMNIRKFHKIKTLKICPPFCVFMFNIIKYYQVPSHVRVKTLTVQRGINRFIRSLMSNIKNRHLPMVTKFIMQIILSSPTKSWVGITNPWSLLWAIFTFVNITLLYRKICTWERRGILCYIISHFFWEIKLSSKIFKI